MLADNNCDICPITYEPINIAVVYKCCQKVIAVTTMNSWGKKEACIFCRGTDGYVIVSKHVLDKMLS